MREAATPSEHDRAASLFSSRHQQPDLVGGDTAVDSGDVVIDQPPQRRLG